MLTGDISAPSPEVPDVDTKDIPSDVSSATTTSQGSGLTVDGIASLAVSLPAFFVGLLACFIALVTLNTMRRKARGRNAAPSRAPINIQLETRRPLPNPSE
jgi:hypothetical protein